ncbi:helix-turn-helix domain-containing protein [Trinickia fusca]|uniref:Helix-turn-helix domain-containing protein n=1 Tax=Trinickia fusca TaxID=2419777 RepID=A0A494XXB7_9BURK|nr:helix-turn-helix domain-containing protein [Trinickia fusca]RKP52233.1 helix-turn-helix domain-containing protein [Trinickia fusca]
MTIDLSCLDAPVHVTAPRPPARVTACARVHTSVAHDADEQARNLHGWRQTYDQLSPGRFTGTLTECFLDDLTVFREVTSHALRQTCEIDSDAYWFGIPILRDGMGRIDGHAIDGEALAFRPGGIEFELTTPADYEFFGIVIGGERLRRHAAALAHLGLVDRAPRTELVHIDEPHKVQLCAWLRAVLEESTRGALSLTGCALEHLQASVLETLVALIEPRQPEPLAASTHQRRQAIVAHAREYAIAHRERAINVPELCEQLHVSRRTLQYCFQDVLGMTPAAYLRTLRLNGARRDLANAARGTLDPRATHSVQEIAASWGFWHLSQFAADYRRLFGVRPSETLKGMAGAPLRSN